ncbi:MAG: Rieske 2Fe-2S domain-containing protein [Methanomassiliicoccales archaeon]|nr:Rieske 2Fe-2S domain-containing protein [Methanomassiliicoccales archaeon]MDD1756638.1 Rieske 2Fe-2S domain-containing protein [Methanomassiliicoccales archaeon]
MIGDEMPKVKVAKMADVQPGKMIGLDVMGKRMLLANVGGKMFAMDGVCSHAGGHLWEGQLLGMTVKCPRHGSEFDLATGKNTKKPFLPFAKAPDLRVYPVSVEGDDVVLDI